ncbi:MAG: PAS domain S-box protein [Gemmatimonadota bacterium]|nr:MAG: PAS domain S-box protein [Gemmatimonadota bacterium]
MYKRDIVLKIICFFIFTGLLLFSSSARSQSYLVHTYTENDGLLSSTVYDIAQDTSGVMWFATRRGISGYDGLRWTSYTESDGLSTDSYAFVEADEEGVVWVLSHPPLLSVSSFDGTTWIPHPEPADLTPAFNYTAFEILSDRHQKSIIVGTSSQGVYLYRNDAWKHITLDDGLLSNRVNGIVSFGGNFYVATDNGLSLIRGTGVDNRLNERLPLPSSRIVGIAIEKDIKYAYGHEPIWLLGEDWIGTIEDGKYTLLSQAVETVTDDTYHYIIMRPDSHGGLYYGNPYDLFYLDRSSGSCEHLGQENGLITEGVLSLLIDREENVWVTNIRGVSKIASRRFANYQKVHGLLDNEVTAILEYEPGKLLFGHNNGLTFFDGSNFTTLPFSAEYASHAETRVLDIRSDSEKNMWVAASPLGLARIDQNGITKWYRRNEGLAGSVTSVFVEKSGKVWAALSEGLYALHDDTFARVTTGDLPQAYMRRIFQGPQGSLYFATIYQGVYEYRNEKWYQYVNPAEEAANSVYAVVMDSRGEIWVGTLAGLYRLQNASLVKFETDGFEISRPVYLIIEDNKERLWFGTDNGVIRWDGEHVREYTTYQGFVGRETNRAAGIVDSRGNIWIGTDMGVSCYQEQFDSDYESIPPPQIELLHIEASGVNLFHNTSHELNYDRNNLIFHFRCVSFINEEFILYRCKLDGFETEWTPEYQSADRQIRYTNLKPGHYRFHIQAKNALGVWSPIRSSGVIVIQRPFWMQWWFYILPFMCIGLVFGIVALHISRKRYTSRLEGEIRERTNQLRESEEKYRHLISNATDAIATVDYDGRFLIVNEAAARIMGGEPADFFNKTIWDVFPKEFIDERMKKVRDVFQSGQGYESEMWIPVNGEKQWFRLSMQPIRDQSGKITSVLSISADITERKQAEQALQNSEEMYRTLVETSPDAVTVTDLKGNITYASKQTCELHGYAGGAELIGKNALELVAPEDRQKAIRNTQKTIKEGAVRNIEYTLMKKNGSRFIGELNASLLKDASGEPKAFIATVRDVTEREQLRTQLLQTEKMSALGQLISGVAHELNNPLTGVLGYSQLLLMSPHLSEEAKQSIGKINQEAERARKIIQNLLAFARQQKPEKRRVQINEVINRVLDLRAYEMRVSNIEVVKKFDRKCSSLFIDEHQLQQVFMNIIINAEQAMLEAHGRGRLEVTTSCDPERDVLQISFKDDGPGIADENLSRIFNPFFTTKPVGQGTGLGLSISYGIVEEHGGRITAVSREGQGATFTIELPVGAVVASELAVTPEQPETNFEIDRKRILVVDDEVSIVDLIREALEREGYDVEIAFDGKTALQKIDEDRFDVIICDVKMPHKSGVDIYKYCEENKPAFARHFLFLTGDVVAPESLRFIEENRLPYLSKPFDLRDLVSSVDGFLHT